MNATRAARPSPMRRFDPQRLGRLECDAWVTYYLRDWRRFLVAAISMGRVGVGMSWSRTVHGAWLVLRANQVWAPYPDNDPEQARRLMERFYELVARTHDETFDVEQAARLEVAWWESTGTGNGTTPIIPSMCSSMRSRRCTPTSTRSRSRPSV